MTRFFPEIYRVEKISGKETTLEPETKIIGVRIKNETVAYPLDEVVIPRHIINDTIANTPVLVSYCALCRSALAFQAEVDGQPLYFKVAGVWRRNMIMVDDQTRSLWQQATGDCIYGKYKGHQLPLLSGENTIWQAWIKKHQDTLFAEKCYESRRGILPRNLMLKGIHFATTRVTMPGYSDLSALPVRETVFGISYNGVAKAYPLSEIKNKSIFTDTLGTVIIELDYDSQAEYLNATEKETGTALVVEKHWWLGWKEFHPDTGIWEG